MLAELLHQLVGHGLLPLEPVRLPERGDVEPAVVLHSAGDHLRRVPDVPVHQLQGGAEGAHLLEDRARRVLRHRDVGLQARRRGVRGRGGACVPRRGEGNGLEAQLPRPGDGRREPAGLEAAGGVLPFVLEPEALHAQGPAQAIGLEERGQPFAQREAERRVSHGEHLRVPPDGGRPAHQGRRREPAPQVPELVAGQERLRAAGGGAPGLFRVPVRRPALPAFQVGDAGGRQVVTEDRHDLSPHGPTATLAPGHRPPAQAPRHRRCGRCADRVA